MAISIRDFQPLNKWKEDETGTKWQDGGCTHIIDQSTGHRYLNQSKSCIRIKCLLLSIGTPIVHAIASIVNIAYRIAKLVSFSHFWMPDKDSSSFKDRLKDAGKDLASIITQPLALVGLQLAAVYGIFNPLDGRKLYASIERAQYGDFVLAPCFQPEARRHLFKGDINEKGAW